MAQLGLAHPERFREGRFSEFGRGVAQLGLAYPEWFREGRLVNLVGAWRRLV